MSTINVPRLCGTCHREDSPVSNTRNIPQTNILENYKDSIHGIGLFQQGLTVTTVCSSCHTAHNVLPHKEFERDRPREYRRLVESGEVKERLMPAPAARDISFWRRLGFTALGIGLALIVYAMLFVYR